MYESLLLSVSSAFRFLLRLIEIKFVDGADEWGLYKTYLSEWVHIVEIFYHCSQNSYNMLIGEYPEHLRLYRRPLTTVHAFTATCRPRVR